MVFFFEGRLVWLMSDIPVPCHECADRKIGCHGRCDKYKKFRKEVEHMTVVNRARMPLKTEFQNNQKRRSYERQKNRLY